MFDLSAAFDTVDHSIMLRRLEISFGIQGAALEWFSSYLTGRSQQVSVHNVMAMSVFLDYGVPQGSVLGPVLFLLYTSDLVELVRSFGLLAHAYADDLQVYCHMNVGSEQVMLQRFRDCADSVSRWMSSNRLKLNPSKTELIWFYSGRRQLSFVENGIELFGNRIAPVHTVRDLGVMLDSNMTMSQHVLRVLPELTEHPAFSIARIVQTKSQNILLCPILGILRCPRLRFGHIFIVYLCMN